MTVWIYVENAKQVGDRDHLKVFRARTRPRMVVLLYVGHV
jgi:hypothetical protein